MKKLNDNYFLTFKQFQLLKEEFEQTGTIQTGEEYGPDKTDFELAQKNKAKIESILKSSINVDSFLKQPENKQIVFVFELLKNLDLAVNPQKPILYFATGSSKNYTVSKDDIMFNGFSIDGKIIQCEFKLKISSLPEYAKSQANTISIYGLPIEIMSPTGYMNSETCTLSTLISIITDKNVQSKIPSLCRELGYKFTQSQEISGKYPADKEQGLAFVQGVSTQSKYTQDMNNWIGNTSGNVPTVPKVDNGNFAPDIKEKQKP